MTSAAPHYPLDEVKKLVAAGDFVVMKGRALNLLVPPLTYAEARNPSRRLQGRATHPNVAAHTHVSSGHEATRDVPSPLAETTVAKARLNFLAATVDLTAFRLASW